MAITKAVYDTLPDEVKSQFEEVNGEYSHLAEGKAAALKKSLNDLNAKKEAEKEAAQAALAEAEKSKADEVAAATAKALEDAIKTNNKDDIKTRYEEMLAHQKAQAEAQILELQQKNEGFITKSKESARGATLAEIKSKLKVYDDCASVFDLKYGSRIDVCPDTGKRTYLDENGSATSLDDAGFLESISSDPAVSRMREASPPSSGGMAQGSGNSAGSAQNSTDQTAKAAADKGDVSGYLDAVLTPKT